MKIGPKFKIARRLGARIFPKTQTTKFTTSTGGTSRGGGRGRPRALSDYGAQLIEKQKARYTYGLKEHQFASYVKKARAAAGQNPVAALYGTLERRLDNVVFRLGLAPSRAFARQMVTHGHVVVNGRRVNVPSYQVKVGDKVGVREQSKGLGLFKSYEERTKDYRVPTWLSFDQAAKAGVLAAEPLKQDADVDINFSSILEFYSRV